MADVTAQSHYSQTFMLTVNFWFSKEMVTNQSHGHSEEYANLYCFMVFINNGLNCQSEPSSKWRHNIQIGGGDGGEQ